MHRNNHLFLISFFVKNGGIVTRRFFNLYLIKTILFFVLLMPSLSYGAKVYKITIKQAQLIEPSLIRSHLSLKVGQNYSSYKVRQDVKKLFSLGFFENIEVHDYSSKKGKHVIYKVKERPLIGEIEFQDNENINSEELKEFLTVKPADFLNFNKLYETINSVKKEYKEKGYFFVNVSHQIFPLPDTKKVKLVIRIKEGKKILIKKINFIGARNISAKKLKSRMTTKEQNIMSLLGSSGVYNPENLDRDIQLIEYLYRNQGYLNARLERPEISISPDQKGVYINLTISEGPRFKVGQVGFQGDDVVSEKDVQSKLKLKEDHYFALGNLHADINTIQFLYKEKGYVFAKVNPQIYPDPSGEEKVHVLFVVKKDQIYKIGKIFIKGNHKTRDKVILRRLFLREGMIFQESKRQLMENLLQQLGFFEKVRVQPRKSGSQTVDMHIDLEERESTGEAQLAGGYSGSYVGLFIKGGIKKNNFLGLDQSVSFQMDFNRYQELFNFNYMNPYFLDTDWSLGVDVFNFGQDMLNNQGSQLLSFQNQGIFYSQLNTGFSFSVGHHLSDFSRMSLKYRLQKQSLDNQSLHFFRKLPVVSSVFNFLFGKPRSIDESASHDSQFIFSDIYPLEEGKGWNSSLSGIYAHDKRNDLYYPSKGYYGRFSLEWSGLGGNFKYIKAEGDARYYYSLPFQFVLKNKLHFGMVSSYAKNKQVPFTEMFLLGGPYNLRGYKTNTIGPRKFSQKAFEYAQQEQYEDAQYFAERPFGGSQMFYYILELEFPIIKAAQLKGAVFFDIGEVANQLKFDLNNSLRMDIGVGVRWRSPFGPLNIDLGFPYKPQLQYGENPIEVQFGIGSSF